MKYIKIATIIFLVANLIIACRESHPERNKLIFPDKIENIQDSLVTMTTLLDVLPKSNHNTNTNYRFNDKGLYINDTLVKINISDKYLSTYYTLSQKKHLFATSSYLNQNFISSAFFDSFSQSWRFMYRESPEARFNDARDLLILNDSIHTNLSLDTILEKKDKLYLLAPKGAKLDK